jgi:hypothetical protein
MCMIDYGDNPTIGWSEKHRLSRKDHKCGECGRGIAKGEHYWYASGVCDGRGFSAKVCEHCHVVTDWLSANCGGYIYGGQIDDFQEHSEACLPMLRLVVGARRQWQSFSDVAKLLPVQPYPGDMI